MATNYSAGSASVDITPSFDDFVRDLRAFLASVDAELVIQVAADIARARTQIRSLHADHGSLTIQVDADTASAEAQIATAARDRTSTVQINADTTAAEARIALLEARLAALNSSSSPGAASSSSGSSRGSARGSNDDNDLFIQQMRRQLAQAAREAELRIPLTPDGERLRRELRRLVAEAEGSTRVNFSPGMDPAAVARLRADIQRQVDQINQIAPAANSVTNSSDRAHRSLNLMSGVRFTALASAIGALVPVIGGVIGAAGALGGILGAVGLTAGVGGAGIGDAFTAMKQSTEGAAAAAEDYQSKLDSLEDAQQRVVNAQRDEKSALEAVTDAQKARTSAALDAKDAIDNLNLAVNNGVLSERGAEIAYRRAVVRQQEVLQRRARGEATQLDVDSAQLDVDQAAQNITNVRVSNAQTTRDRDEANTKGVAGSDQVSAADKALEAARLNVTQSQEATQSAIRDLARAQEAANKAFAESTGQTDDLAEALAKLAPSAADFVLQMKDLGPRWSELRKAVQQELFDGLGTTVTDYFTNQADAMQDTFVQLADGLNDSITGVFDQFDDMWTRLEENGSLQAFIDAVNESMQYLAPTLTGITEAFMNFTVQAGPSIGRLFASIGDLLVQTSGPLGQLGAVLADTLAELMPDLGAFVNELAINLAPILPQLGDTLTAIFDALTPLLPDMGEFIVKLGELLENLAPLLEPLGNLVFDNLNPLMDSLADFAGNSATLGAADAIIKIANALTKLLYPVNTLVAGIEALTNPQEGLPKLVRYLDPILPGNQNLSDDFFIDSGETVSGTSNTRPARPASEVPLRYGFADGGLFRGRGGPRDDANLIGISDYEFVVNADATQQHLPLLTAINDGRFRGMYADGGWVSDRINNSGGDNWVQQRVDNSDAAGDGRLQPDTQRLIAAVRSTFPEITDIGGYRPDGGGYNDHPSGRAADIMIPGWSSDRGVQLGDQIASWVEGNAAPFGVEYLIWRQMYRPIGGEPNLMEDRGSPTQNHMDHMHVTTEGNSGTGNAVAPQRSSQQSGAPGTPGTTYYSPTGTYVGPSSVDATGDLAELGATSNTDTGLPAQYSLQGILGRAGVILADGILSGLGLENSILSSNNVYNRAINETIGFYSQQQQSGQAGYIDPGVTASSTPPSTPVPGGFAGVSAQGSTGGGNTVYDPNAGVDQWEPNIVAALQREGFPVTQRNIDLTKAQMRTESGGNPSIIQGVQDVNSGGNEAVGLMQVTPGTFDAYRNPALPNDRTDPDASLSAALRYYRDRYGDDLGAMWGQGHGYDQGGIANGIGLMLKQTIRPERVLSPQQTETFDSVLPLLESINSRSWQPAAPEWKGGALPGNQTSIDRSNNFYGTQVGDYRELVDEVERRAYMEAAGGMASMP